MILLRDNIFGGIRMDRYEILNVIKELSMSQGFYGRLLARLQEVEEFDPEAYDEFMTQLEEENFQEPLDVVLYFEQ